MNDNTTAHNSSEYDENIEKTIPFYSTFHSEILKIIRVCTTHPPTWLDTGCGTGTLVFNAAKEFPDTEFYLCDPSKEMLEIAIGKNCGRRVASLGAVESAAIDNRFNGFFDVVTAIQSHHYKDRAGREQSTKRCFDVLKKGGVYLTFENTSSFTPEGEEIYREYWKRFQIDAGKTDANARKHIARYNVEYFPINVQDHIALLKSVGFGVVELFWYSYMQSGYFCIK